MGGETDFILECCGDSALARISQLEIEINFLGGKFLQENGAYTYSFTCKFIFFLPYLALLKHLVPWLLLFTSLYFVN